MTELNYSDYFRMWGLDISPALEWSLLTLGYPMVERVYYAAEAIDSCSLWSEAREIPIDGESLWVDLSVPQCCFY